MAWHDVVIVGGGNAGISLAARLRRDPTTRETLLVAVSGYGQPDDRRRSREAGFHHHLVKPVDPQELLTLISNADARAV